MFWDTDTSNTVWCGTSASQRADIEAQYVTDLTAVIQVIILPIHIETQDVTDLTTVIEVIIVIYCLPCYLLDLTAVIQVIIVSCYQPCCLFCMTDFTAVLQETMLLMSPPHLLIRTIPIPPRTFPFSVSILP